MTWSYRVCRKKVDKTYVYGIHEAYYNKGKVTMLTQEPCTPFGEDVNELKRDYILMHQALSKPVIDYKTLKEIK